MSQPFDSVPHQSVLFTQYLNDPLSLEHFYPSAVAKPLDVAERIPDVLSHYTIDRGCLCDALDEFNRDTGSGERTFDNINLLREPETVAVVTGQQAGLFTGPLYTIYKALSAVKMAECLSKTGRKAVPVFWIATEDHDFDEVSKASVRGKDCRIDDFSYRPVGLVSDVPVGDISVDDSISETIKRMMADLPSTEFSADLEGSLRDAYAPGEQFGLAFAKLLATLFSGCGLILIDPMRPKIKELAAPIYIEAIKHAETIVAGLTERSRELVDAGFHAQVLAEDDYFPLFWHTDAGKRTALRRSSNGRFRSKADRREFSLAELAGIAAGEPERFSPGVMLRPVVQDFLLPTVCYLGGGAEIAYFAQNSEVYRVLQRPVTPILHRQSFTVIERKFVKTMEQYGLNFADLFAGRAEIRKRIVDEHLSPDTPRLFADVEERFNTELNRLDRELSQIDSTLADNLATRRRKILYHISALREKAYNAHIRRDEMLERRIDAMFDTLLPNGGLQERTLNIATFLNSYGSYFVEWMLAAVDLDDHGHRVVYL